MARFRNDTFKGVEVDMVDPNEFTYSEALRNAVADTALVEDLVYGQSPPSGASLTHVGKDGSRWRGSLLGYPNNVLVPRGAYSTAHTSGAPPPRGYVYLCARYLPRGETSLTVLFEMEPNTRERDTRVRVFEVVGGAWSEVDATVRITGTNTGMWARFTADVSGLVGGRPYYIGVDVPFSGVSSRRVGGFSTFHDRRYRESPGEVSRLMTNRYPLDTAPEGGATVRGQAFVDEVLLGIDRPYQAHVVNTLARIQNTLYESLTGAPCGGNATHTLEDSDDVAPTTSAFYDHSRAGALKSGESLVDVPLWAEPFGAVKLDGSGHLTDNYGCPGLCTGAKTTGPATCLYIPHAPRGAGSTLTVHVLVCNPDGTKPSVTVYAQAIDFDGAGGGAEKSATVQWLTGAQFGVATITGLDFAPDDFNLLATRYELGGTPKGDGSELRVVSACAYLAGA